MKENKVLYVCSEFFAGMLPFGASIVNAMSLSGLDVYGIFVSTTQCNYKSVISSEEKSKFIFINSPINKLGRGIFRIFSLPVIFAIIKLCKRHRIDCIHLLTEDTGIAQYSYLLKALFPNLRFYYTVHDLVPHESTVKSNKALIRTLLVDKRVDYLIRSNSNLITSSKDQYNSLVRSYPEKKIHYHSFPTLVTEAITSGTGITSELCDVENYILFFGRIEFYKGVHLLYEAYINNDDLKKHPLVIAGSGLIYFERNIDKESNVFFVNRYITDSEIRNLFSKARCVVYPYISATQSGVLSIANYFKVPTIASDISFFSNLIDHKNNGLLFKQGDKQDLAVKLRLVGTMDVSVMVERGFKNYLEVYDNSSLVKQLEQIYNEDNKRL